jgi:heme oxygenase
MSISKLLKESSRPQHEQAETSKFVVELMRGQLNIDAYKKYLTNLAWLYLTLEAKIQEGEPVATSEALWDERLNRLEAIGKDLDALGIHNWQQTTEPSKAMRSYIDHIESLDGKSDFKLIAHHYTRYLGDLSGGQAIAALVARHYGATSEQLNFYRFTEIEDLVRFKEHYRNILDGLQFSAKQIDELVQEVQLAFEFNQKVFEDLAN